MKYCKQSLPNGPVIGLFVMKDRNYELFSADLGLTDPMLFIEYVYILYIPKLLITLFT